MHSFAPVGYPSSVKRVAQLFIPSAVTDLITLKLVLAKSLMDIIDKILL